MSFLVGLVEYWFVGFFVGGLGVALPFVAVGWMKSAADVGSDIRSAL